MALTKGTAIAVASSVTTSQTTTGVSIATAYRATLGVSIVQVGAATTAATFNVQVSFDGGTDYFDVTGVVGAGTAAATYLWTVPLPDDASHVRIVFTAQAGGTSSTLSAEAGAITAL
jgi:hypothetical protein